VLNDSLKRIMGLMLMMMAITGITAPAKASGAFIARDHIVIDLTHGVEWMRCSVGQTWDGTSCTGDIVKLNHDAIKQAIELANEQLGGDWRLPNLKELEGLLCDSCEAPKIDTVFFPATSAEPYWTGETNSYAPRHIYTVNFFNGYVYGRFFPFQEMAVRFVRDR
jgi:hypothetical protein